MMVKVWNDNDHVFKTKFKGDEIIIKPHQFIEMERFHANDLRGQYHPIVIAANGLQDPTSYQMLRIELETDKKEDVEINSHYCMQCKKSYESEPVLKAHIDTQHADTVRLELPEVDEEIKKRGRPKKVG